MAVSVGSVVSPPIPAYQNVPIMAGYFQPSQFFISAISLGVLTTITATASMNYILGQECRLLIPPSFGSRQLNGLSGIVVGIPANDQVVLGIDSSRNVDAFINSNYQTETAQIMAIGDVNNGVIFAGNVRNIYGNPAVTIPGAFINISPL